MENASSVHPPRSFRSPLVPGFTYRQKMDGKKGKETAWHWNFINKPPVRMVLQVPRLLRVCVRVYCMQKYVETIMQTRKCSPATKFTDRISTFPSEFLLTLSFLFFFWHHVNYRDVRHSSRDSLDGNLKLRMSQTWISRYWLHPGKSALESYRFQFPRD